jgi:hypothetical protein
MSKTWGFIWTIVLNFILIGAAWGIPIGYDFSGTISRVDIADYEDSYPLSSITTGIGFNGSFVYNVQAAQEWLPGEYEGAIENINIEFANVSLGSGHAYVILKDSVEGDGRDSINMYSPELDATIYGYGTNVWDDLWIVFSDSTGAALDDIELPEAINPAAFDSMVFNVFPRGASFEIAGTVYGDISWLRAAPVPEPATMLLFGTGLIGLAGFRFRKRFKK